MAKDCLKGEHKEVASYEDSPAQSCKQNNKYSVMLIGHLVLKLVVGLNIFVLLFLLFLTLLLLIFVLNFDKKVLSSSFD